VAETAEATAAGEAQKLIFPTGGGGGGGSGGGGCGGGGCSPGRRAAGSIVFGSSPRKAGGVLGRRGTSSTRADSLSGSGLKVV
jgi:hypothetical protein